MAVGKNQRPTSEATPGLGRAPGGVVRVFTEGSECTSGDFGFIPYCSMAQAQLSFHGHRDAVKFFVAVPGISSVKRIISEKEGKSLQSELKQAISKDRPEKNKPDSMLILSGGEGYIDFRIGDGDDDEHLLSLSSDTDERRPVLAGKGDQSHLIVWQVALSE